MAEADAGLELPIGLTEQKFMQQLARIEARAIKAAKTAEQAFVKSNSGITRSTASMSREARGQLQNVSFQLQDVIVQIQGGTSASRALAQQLPQLLGGFGALGAALGVVAGLGIPFVASLLNMEEEAVDLDKAVKGLTEGLEALRTAQQNAAIPVDQLILKYGALADEMARVFQNQLSIARHELEAMGAEIEKAIGATADLTNMVTRFDSLKQAVDAGVISYDEYIRLLRDLEQQFGFTAAQALQYQNLMDGVASAEGPEQQAQAWLAVHDWLEANREALAAQGVAVDDLIRQTNELAAGYGDAHKAAADATAAAEAGGVATDTWAAAAANLAANMDGAAAAAGRAAAALGAAIAAQNQAAGLGGIGGIDPFSQSSGRVITALAGGMNLPQQYEFDRQWQAQVEAQEKAAAEAARRSKRSGGGSRRRSGGGRGKEPVDIFEAAARDITNLERQIQLVGKSAEETARLRAQWEMLDAAKKAGIPINDQLNARIEAQAAQVGQLTAELERAELAQEQFDQAIDGIADAFAGALVAGESLRDGLAQVLKQIAADIINSGIRNALMGQFGSAGGGGGGFFSSLFGGLFGGFRAAGGPVDPGRAYVVGEKGPELIVPKSAGMVIPNHKLRGGGGGSSSVSLTVDLRGTTGDRELDAKIASAGRAILAQVPQAMSEAQKRRPGPWGA